MSISDPIPSQTIIDTLFVIAPQFYTTDPTKLANYNTMIGLLRCQVNEQGLILLRCTGIRLSFSSLASIANQPSDWSSY